MVTKGLLSETHGEEHELGAVGGRLLDGRARVRNVTILVRRRRELAQRYLELRSQKKTRHEVRQIKPRAASEFRIQSRGNPGVTLDSGGVGRSRAGGERASSGLKELGAAAMAATRRSGRREGEEMRARLAQSFRRGARSAAAVDVATALISSWEMPWRCRECGG